MIRAGTRRHLLLTAAFVTLIGPWLTACAPSTHVPKEADSTPEQWSGRLALQVQGNAAHEDVQAQSFSAGFALQGTPQRGELRLFSPLGNTLAVLEWHAGGARLTQGQKQHQAESLQALTEELAQDFGGSALPVTALFAWLKGESVQIAGWQADASALATQGRLTATRYTPTPRAVLRVILDR